MAIGEKRTAGSGMSRVEKSGVSPPPFKAIIFDIDGVLADSREAVVRNTLELMQEFGFAVKRDVVEGMSSAHSAESVLVALEPSLAGEPALLKKMLARLGGITAKNIDLVKPTALVGAVPALDKKYLLAVASNRKTSVRMVLEKLRLSGYFKVVMTSSDAPPKPDPKMINMAVEKLGVAAKEALFVGDNREDEHAGVGAGVKFRMLNGVDEKECALFLGEVL